MTNATKRAKNTFRKAKEYCCESITLIENYELAAADKENLWDVHHRKEDEGFTREQLKEMNMYFNRPASELLFIEHNEHSKHHNKGKNMCGKNNPFYGKSPSAEHRHKIGLKNSKFWKNKKTGEILNTVQLGIRLHKAILPKYYDLISEEWEKL